MSGIEEPIPPLIIPGTVIDGVDEDGVPQPAYTFKQAVSVCMLLASVSKSTNAI